MVCTHMGVDVGVCMGMCVGVCVGICVCVGGWVCSVKLISTCVSLLPGMETRLQ